MCLDGQNEIHHRIFRTHSQNNLISLNSITNSEDKDVDVLNIPYRMLILCTSYKKKHN
jgi:hypothetical protein